MISHPIPRGIHTSIDRSEIGPAEAERALVPGDIVLTVRRRWIEWSGVVLFAAVCAWDALLVQWYTWAELGWGWVIWPLPHVLAGLAMTYVALAAVLNRTTVRADSHAIVVTHGPLPWPFARTLAVAPLRRAHVERVTRRDGRPRFRVMVAAEFEAAHAVVSGLPESHAEYLALALRTHLDLKE